MYLSHGKEPKEGEGIKSLAGKQACWKEKVNTVRGPFGTKPVVTMFPRK